VRAKVESQNFEAFVTVRAAGAEKLRQRQVFCGWLAGLTIVSWTAQSAVSVEWNLVQAD
jgi:hypothetical protein